MKKRIKIFIILWLFTLPVFSQDYFDDVSGNGFAIAGAANKDVLAAGRINTKDNSVKVNLFKFFSKDFEQKDEVGEGTILPSTVQNYTLPPKIKAWGLGINLKGKSENGMGTLLSKNAFSPGFSTGLYLAHQTVKIASSGESIDKQKFSSSSRTFLFSLNYTSSTVRLFDDIQPFQNMKMDKTINGFNASAGVFFRKSINKNSEGDKEDNFIWGLSFEYARKNNYGQLDKFEIKDSRTIVDSANNTSRTIQNYDEDGYLYAARSAFKVNNVFKIRINGAWIPKAFNYRVAMILYPSLDILENSRLRTNIGASLSFLEKGDPTLSIGGIFFELNDINNTENSSKGFFARSFKVGITAAINIFTGKFN